MMLQIRKAEMSELPDILPLFDRARAFMANTGNPNQWGGDYPNETITREDITKSNCYVCTSDGQIECVFSLIYGNDPWYEKIYDGAWLNDEPYAAVHRMASAGRVKGLARFCLDWAVAEAGNIRIDTYIENEIMKKLLVHCGFTYCGIIRIPGVGDGVAYQRMKGE